MDLKDGETTEMKGSGAKPYVLKNVGGVYSCSCPAWRNQSTSIDRRTCKHLRKLRGDAAEEARIGAVESLPALRTPTVKNGETVTPPEILLAQDWAGQDPTGWHMSEKLDGVRALWKDGKFITRKGNLYLAPPWFTVGLPNKDLDGELWMGRKLFQKTVSVVRRYDAGDAWKEVRFIVFDAPHLKVPFEERIAAIPDLLSLALYARPHTHEVVRDEAHVREELARVEALGAEGLMLRKPGSMYEACRSNTLLKVKSFSDSEATVTGYQPGKGKYKGMTGALIAQWGDKTIEVGTGLSDAERADPPKVGTVIKFKYFGETDGGMPRHPSYLGLDDD